MRKKSPIFGEKDKIFSTFFPVYYCGLLLLTSRNLVSGDTTPDITCNSNTCTCYSELPNPLLPCCWDAMQAEVNTSIVLHITYIQVTEYYSSMLEDRLLESISTAVSRHCRYNNEQCLLPSAGHNTSAEVRLLGVSPSLGGGILLVVTVKVKSSSTDWINLDQTQLLSILESNAQSLDPPSNVHQMWQMHLQPQDFCYSGSKNRKNNY